MKQQKKEFYPDYLLEILVVIFITAEIAVLLALLFPEPVGRRIDFSLPFQPRPEWYFLWLYQLIRYFPGKWIGIGTLLIPATVMSLLVLIPFVDRGKHGRRLAILSGGFLLFGFLFLTLSAWFAV